MFLFIDLDIASMIEVNVIVLKTALVRVLVVEYGLTFRLPLLAGVSFYYPPMKIIQSVATSVKSLPVYAKPTRSLSI